MTLYPSSPEPAVIDDARLIEVLRKDGAGVRP